MIYDYQISQYISTLKTKSGIPMREKDKTQVLNVLTAFCAEYMSDPFKKWPDKSDYDAYRVTLSDKPKLAKDNISRIEKFFAWLNSDKETDNMTDKETTPELIPVDTHTEISHPADDGAVTPIEPEISQEVSTGDETAQPKNLKAKTGRRPFDTVNGEKKSEKLMMYFTPELIADIRDWCYLKRISCVSYITALIEADLKTDDKQKKLAFFREMSNDA